MSNMKSQEEQKMIIRQSQIKLALDYFNTCSVCPTLTDLIKTTTMLEDYITNGYSKDMVNKFEKLDSYINQQYKNNK